jgi:hypothetical protein
MTDNLQLDAILSNLDMYSTIKLKGTIGKWNAEQLKLIIITAFAEAGLTHPLARAFRIECEQMNVLKHLESGPKEAKRVTLPGKKTKWATKHQRLFRSHSTFILQGKG